jgi:hypothetical protein
MPEKRAFREEKGHAPARMQSGGGVRRNEAYGQDVLKAPVSWIGANATP